MIVTAANSSLQEDRGGRAHIILAARHGQCLYRRRRGYVVTRQYLSIAKLVCVRCGASRKAVMLPVATMTAFIAVNVSYEPELTPAERIELAEHMIALWSQFKALAKKEQK
jgi:hypothetical protein